MIETTLMVYALCWSDWYSLAPNRWFVLTVVTASRRNFLVQLLSTFVHRTFFFFLMTRRPPRSPLFPYTTLFRSVRRARPGDLGPLPRSRAGRLTGPRSAQVARRSRRCRLRARAARRRPARRVQPHPAVPAPERRRAGRHVRRVRARADETVPGAQDLGDDRRMRPRRHRLPGGAGERARPRARHAGRGRAGAGAGRRARDVHRRLSRAPGGVSNGPAERRQPRAARGGSGAGPGLRHRHRLRRPRDA